MMFPTLFLICFLGTGPVAPLDVTPVVSTGAPTISRSSSSVMITTGEKETIKVLLGEKTVLTLWESTMVSWKSGRTLLLLKGTIEIAVASGENTTLSHEGLLFSLPRGIHRLSVSPVKTMIFTETPSLVSSKEGEKPTAAETVVIPRKLHLARDLCLLVGKLTLSGTEKWCHQKKCLKVPAQGSCLLGKKHLEENSAPLFLPPLLTVRTPLDFIALLPVLSRTLQGGPGKASSSDTSVGGQGGSMCLDSTSGSGSAGDVGQSNQQTVKPLPYTRLTLRIVFR
ncbi:hypothetical protein KKF84_01400 [Myxococcota bacterium]|nr:hypothetical protein [Myxococcota bacterium]